VPVARSSFVPPDPPLTDGEIVLRPQGADDVPLIAEASHDPETRRWLDDEPLAADRQRDSVARAEEKWRSGESAPFVIADAATDAPLGLLNLQFGDDHEVAELAVSVFPRARGRGVASKALRLGAIWGLHEVGLHRGARARVVI
jgi:RimJ/RimL family protein N-acetyltransferase